MYEKAAAIFIAERCEPSGMLALLRMGRRSPVAPSYARVRVLRTGGGSVQLVPFTGRFTIGGDPCLWARQVRSLRELRGGRLEWDEVPVPGPVTMD